MAKKKAPKKNILSDFHSTTIKLFGIPIFTIKKTLSIDEAELYSRLEKKFERNMTKALEKAVGKTNAG